MAVSADDAKAKRQTAASTTQGRPIRIGAVTYLNAKPLIVSLAKLVPYAEIVIDYPSRLADGLRAEHLDVAMIPSVEYARQPGCRIISDACIACDGPVRSVKLFSRVSVDKINTLALDEGSRTSAALARILLKERFGRTPAIATLPIGSSIADVPADAAVLIGDRGMRPIEGTFEFVWDLGEEWLAWTGLPFVFAMWIARPSIHLHTLSADLAAARDDGIMRFEEIARSESPVVGIPEAECLSYFQDCLEFHLGDRQRQALELYYALAAKQNLAPAGVKLDFYCN